jgi:hypothetical protein
MHKLIELALRFKFKTVCNKFLDNLHNDHDHPKARFKEFF